MASPRRHRGGGVGLPAITQRPHKPQQAWGLSTTWVLLALWSVATYLLVHTSPHSPCPLTAPAHPGQQQQAPSPSAALGQQAAVSSSAASTTPQEQQLLAAPSTHALTPDAAPPPPEQLLHHQEQQQPAPGDPVDIVYIWSNSSDLQLQKELQQLEDTIGSQGDSGGQHHALGRGWDGLRLSLRSLDQFLPWYRHVFIVTNGQVPSWLDIGSERVTVVPHTSIFADAANHLPTFNTNAVQANVANIPGLSEKFILMDEACFLTKPWSLRDFLAPDGGQVITGTVPVREYTDPSFYSGYWLSLRVLESVFTKEFGPYERLIPAPGPKLMERRMLWVVQQQFPALFAQTAATRCGAAPDTVIVPSYFWYIAQFQEGRHPRAPASRVVNFNSSDRLARVYLDAVTRDLKAQAKAGDSWAAELLPSDTVAAWGRSYWHAVVQYASERAEHGKPGRHLLKTARVHARLLQEAWASSGAKAVCIKNGVTTTAAAVLPLLNRVATRFLLRQYVKPSRFELPAGTTNGCRHRLPATPFGGLPSPADYQAACKQPVAKKQHQRITKHAQTASGDDGQ